MSRFKIRCSQDRQKTNANAALVILTPWGHSMKSKNRAWSLRNLIAIARRALRKKSKAKLKKASLTCFGSAIVQHQMRNGTRTSGRDNRNLVLYPQDFWKLHIAKVWVFRVMVAIAYVFEICRKADCFLPNVYTTGRLVHQRACGSIQRRISFGAAWRRNKESRHTRNNAHPGQIVSKRS